jgi:hypothetical protein
VVFIAGMTNAIQQDLALIAAMVDKLTARVAELEKSNRDPASDAT